MVRNAKDVPSPGESGAAENLGTWSGFQFPDGSMGAAREWMSGSLAAAQNVASWLDQSQKLNLKAVNIWHDNLSEAIREAEHADDMQKLLGVATQLINRQMGATIQQFGSSVKQALETEAQWMERVRSSAVSASQRMLQTGLPIPPSEGGNGLPLVQLGHAQAEWLSMTQRWIDAVKAAQAPLP